MVIANCNLLDELFVLHLDETVFEEILSRIQVAKQEGPLFLRLAIPV